MVQSIPTQIRIDKNVENTRLEPTIEETRKTHTSKSTNDFYNVDDLFKDM